MDPLCQNRDMVLAQKSCPCAGLPATTATPAFWSMWSNITTFSSAQHSRTQCSWQTTQFCICTEDLPNISPSCEKSHNERTGVLHWLFPIAVKFRVGSEKSIEFLRNKVSYFLSASGKLQHNLVKVKESRKLIQSNFEKLNGDANPLLVLEKNKEIAAVEASRNFEARNSLLTARSERAFTEWRLYLEVGH